VRRAAPFGGQLAEQQLLEELQEQGSGDQKPDQADARGDG